MLKRFFLSERAMIGMIMLNAIIIFLLAFPSLEHNFWLIRIDHAFIILFTIEAIVKIRGMGVSDYLENRWNVFDLFIVVFSLPELLQYVGSFSDTASFIMIFRLFRLIRLVRFIEFVPNMKHILIGLRRAFRASVFVLIALMFMNFMLSIIATHLYRGIVPQYFGNPLLSAFTIFQMFTLEGWNEIPKAIASAEGSTLPMIWGARIYFVFVVLSGGIFGMSLANAIFVDEMTMDNNLILEEKIDELQLQMDNLEKLLREKSDRK